MYMMRFCQQRNELMFCICVAFQIDYGIIKVWIKMFIIIKEKDLTYGRGYVYSLQYHIVWCTKYRKQILKDGIDEELKQMLQ